MPLDERLTFSGGQMERWQPELVTEAESREEGRREQEGPGFNISLIVREN